MGLHHPPRLRRARPRPPRKARPRAPDRGPHPDRPRSPPRQPPSQHPEDDRLPQPPHGVRPGRDRNVVHDQHDHPGIRGRAGRHRQRPDGPHGLGPRPLPRRRRLFQGRCRRRREDRPRPGRAHPLPSPGRRPGVVLGPGSRRRRHDRRSRRTRSQSQRLDDHGRGREGLRRFSRRDAPRPASLGPRQARRTKGRRTGPSRAHHPGPRPLGQRPARLRPPQGRRDPRRGARLGRADGDVDGAFKRRGARYRPQPSDDHRLAGDGQGRGKNLSDHPRSRPPAAGRRADARHRPDAPRRHRGLVLCPRRARRRNGRPASLRH